MAITIKQARKDIREAIRQRGQYSHNICSCVLRQVDEEHGREKANDLVDQFDLTGLFGIHKKED